MTKILRSAACNMVACTMFFSFWLLLLAACSRNGEPNSKEAIVDESHFAASLRSNSSSKPSVQGKEGEEYVSTLAMLVFPYGSRELVGFSYATHDTHHVPATRVQSGRNDIYFLVNCPKDEVEALRTRDLVEAYIRGQKAMPSLPKCCMSL